MKVLLTAFEPFGGHEDNSSARVVEKIQIKSPHMEISKVFLPVLFQKSIYEEILLQYKPDVLILCGQAEGRKHVELELFAMNYMDANISDNQGIWMRNQKINQNGPIAYQATIPAYTIVQTLESSYPIRLSLSAGAYVCNYAFYQSIKIVEELQFGTQVGFIHFPLYEGQRNPKNAATLTLDKMVESLSSILNELRP